MKLKFFKKSPLQQISSYKEVSLLGPTIKWNIQIRFNKIKLTLKLHRVWSVRVRVDPLQFRTLRLGQEHRRPPAARGGGHWLPLSSSARTSWRPTSGKVSQSAVNFNSFCQHLNLTQVLDLTDFEVSIKRFTYQRCGHFWWIFRLDVLIVGWSAHLYRQQAGLRAASMYQPPVIQLCAVELEL